MLEKRKVDWLSTAVLAAAAVNPIYSFSASLGDLWRVPDGDAAVRRAIDALFWGDEQAQSEAIEGWDRFSNAQGIHAVGSAPRNMLLRKASDAAGFFRHVAGSSTLASDKQFAQVGLWLVSGFANQSASERTNKYQAEIFSKKRNGLSVGKGNAILEVKMYEQYKGRQRKASAKEQRECEGSVIADLRSTYQAARAKALEKRALQQQFKELRLETLEEEDAPPYEMPLITTADALEVLGEGEAKLTIPAGFRLVEKSPTPEQLDGKQVASDSMVGKKIVVKFEDFGWCLGVILEKNGDGRRKIKGKRVNFIAQFDMDEYTTDLSLETDEYSKMDDAEYESWALLEPVDV
jgi:hypothetical protein